MIDVVLTDLDSTLCNTEHRAHLAVAGNPRHEDWIEYSKACVNDEPIPGTLAALKILSKTYPIFAVSGRNVEAIQETLEWFERIDLEVAFTRLRRASDDQHNGRYKAAFVRTLRAQGFNPILMFEDHVGVAKLVEAEGVPVVTVKPWYDDTVGVNVQNPGMAVVA
jgi:phosphoglycolate phosphatase-like HAD superfamily hydrolase